MFISNLTVEQILDVAGEDVGAKLISLQNSVNSINSLLASDNIDLDTLQEIIDAIEDVQGTFATLIVNDLTTGGATKALSAQQGVVLKDLVDARATIASIVDNLTTGGTAVPLSAQQGVVLKGLIDTINSTLGTLVSSLKEKAGVVSSGAFTGVPRKATVTFGSAFADANYSVSIVGIDSRVWSIESVTAGTFVVNSNANQPLTGNVYWHATKHGAN